MEVNTTTTTNPINMYDYLNNLFLNKSVFFVIFFIIVAYFILFYYLGNNKNSDNLFSSLSNDFISLSAIYTPVQTISSFEFLIT